MMITPEQFDRRVRCEKCGVDFLDINLYKKGQEFVYWFRFEAFKHCISEAGNEFVACFQGKHLVEDFRLCEPCYRTICEKLNKPVFSADFSDFGKVAIQKTVCGMCSETVDTAKDDYVRNLTLTVICVKGPGPGGGGPKSELLCFRCAKAAGLFDVFSRSGRSSPVIAETEEK